MKKVYILTATAFFAVTAACSEAEENTVYEEAEEAAETNNTPDAEQDPEAVDIVENAIETEREITSMFLDQEIIMTSDDGEAATEDTIEERLWIFPQEEGNVHERREASMFGNPLEYMVSNGEEILIYTEGDDTAYLYPAETEEEMEFADEAAVMEERLNTFDSHFHGEEEVNGYDTYRVSFEHETESHEYWFEQDSYFTVRQVSTMTMEMEETTELNVLDFDLDPEYDPDLFDLEEVVDSDVEIVRTDDTAE